MIQHGASVRRGFGLDTNNARRLARVTFAAAAFEIIETVTNRDSTTVAFFTQWDKSHGTSEQTNWTADTYKTIYSDTSGAGVFAGFLGPTAGGAETTTLELTVDGRLTEIAAVCASGDRAWFGRYIPVGGDEFTTASALAITQAEQINASKTQFTALPGGAANLFLSWRSVLLLGIPLIQYSQSLLVRAKHSANITNSTATAFSGVQHMVMD